MFLTNPATGLSPADERAGGDAGRGGARAGRLLRSVPGVVRDRRGVSAEGQDVQ